MKKLIGFFTLKLAWIFGISFLASFCMLGVYGRLDKAYDGWGVLYAILWVFYMMIVVWIEVGLYEAYDICLTPIAFGILLVVLPFTRSYVGTLVVALLWLMADLAVFTDWDEVLDIIREETQKKEENKKEVEVQNKIIESYGESGIERYNELLKKSFELGVFAYELGVSNEIWTEIEDFLKANPERIKLISGIFDIKVDTILDVYHDLPRKSNGNIDNNFRSIPKVRDVFIQLSDVAEKEFEEKLKICSTEIDSNLTVIKKMLKGNIL